jgi:chorismate mutase
MRAAPLSCLFLALLAPGLVACNDEHQPPKTAAEAAQADMSLEDARREVAELRKRGGGPDPETLAPVASMDEALKVLVADDVYRFQKALAFVEPLPGADALTVRALLHLARARALVTSAAILDELARRQSAERDILASKRESGGADEKRIAQVDEAVRGLVRGAAALRMVAGDDHQTGAKLAAEAQRQRPEDNLALRAGMHATMLAGEWLIFDRQIGKIEKQEPETAEYARALEALTRYANRAEARKHVDAALARNPELVGAMALRVLVEEDPEARFAALEALRAKSPKHPVVILAGPVLAKEHEIAASMRNVTK